MTKNIETLIDQDGIELIVSYRAEKKPDQWEDGHGYHNVGGGHDIDIQSLEIVIGGRGMELSHMLTEKQKEKIIDLLSL